MTLFSRSIRRAESRKNRRGFTLIEILVVIVIIAILAGTIGPAILGRVGEARTSTAKDQIASLSTALSSYMLDNGRYPTTQQGLLALVELPTIDPPANWHGPYLGKPIVPLDPWGRAYIYTSPGEFNPTGFDLYTYGKDGQPGGEETDPDNLDITSWN
jgi:general secretion pathway protein G